jgi:hypothetical protein
MTRCGYTRVSTRDLLYAHQVAATLFKAELSLTHACRCTPDHHTNFSEHLRSLRGKFTFATLDLQLRR